MKKAMLLAMMLAAIVPALAQYGEFDVILAKEEPVSTCA
jgi:hypothetical protein